MATLILSVIAVVGFGALAACLLWAARVLSHKIDEIQPPDIPPEAAYDDADVWQALRALTASIQHIDERFETLTAAVAEGIDHVERNEKRVRGIVLGAKRRFEASDYYDPGVDAEADTLPERDAEGSPEEGVQHVPEDLGGGPSPWDVVPGVNDGGTGPA